MKRWLLIVIFALLVGMLAWWETAVSYPHDATPGAVLFLPYIEKPEPTPTPSPTATPTPQADPEWLLYVNQFRTLADLPHLTENPAWSYGGVLHSRYMVKEDDITHYENPSSPWYTQEGYDAGRYGNIAVSSSTTAPDRFAIDLWMTGPFHAVGIIDPKLAQTGFGSYRENVGLWKMGATLDVSRGRGSLSPGTTFPIPFPKEGGQTWLTRYSGNEFPDPLTSCSGYSAPSGPPIMLQLGGGSITPSVTASSFLRDGTPLDHCIFDETSYVNSNSSMQSLGRAVLHSRDAIVIMPRSPLSVGHTYTASITVNGATHTWSFSVAAARDPILEEMFWETR
jgi:uncharacterized protein YkwD